MTAVQNLKKNLNSSFNGLPKLTKLSLARKCLAVYPDTNKTLLSKVFDINRSNLYLNSKQDIKDQECRLAIEQVLQDNPFYGHRRVSWCLGINHKKALRIMNKYCLYPKSRKNKFIKKSDQGLPKTEYQNLTKDITVTRPNQVWKTDFTYIFFQNKFYYLATILDDFDKTILASYLDKNHNQNLVNKCLELALTENQPEYYHSDQGSEYRSFSHTQMIESHGIKISMSEKSSPWESSRRDKKLACLAGEPKGLDLVQTYRFFQESFYGKFKQELGSLKNLETEEDLFKAIYDQLYYYNNQRLHTTIKDTPANFRRKHLKTK